jgi:phosphoribosylglycinamide formyltransferase-1
MPLKVAVLASHAGSNLRALHAAQQADESYSIVLVISNNSTSAALAYAREVGIPHLHISSRGYPDRGALDQALLAALRRHDADLVVTAGYMKKVGPKTLAGYEGRVLNVHPALLPRHGGQGMYGMHVHRAVLDAGDTLTGASVHLVTADYDQGPVVARREVPVFPDDTPDTLAARVLAAEHALLPAVIRQLAQHGTWPVPLGGQRHETTPRLRQPRWPSRSDETPVAQTSPRLSRSARPATKPRN